MAAFSASRLVWSAISLMTFTIADIWSDCLPSSSINFADASTDSAIRFISLTLLPTTSLPASDSLPDSADIAWALRACSAI